MRRSSRDFPPSLAEEKRTSERIIVILLLFSQINKQDAQGAPISSSILYSFEPEIISESEERERITALAQRDFLIKSYGMLEQIYTAMKRNGTLRPADERKYGLYGRLGHANQCACTFPSHGFHHRRNGHLDGTQIAAVQCQQCSLRGNDVTIAVLRPTSSRLFRDLISSLIPVCFSSAFYTRF